MWLFWPSKANKRNNRARKKVVNQFRRSFILDNNHNSLINTADGDDNRVDKDYDSVSDYTDSGSEEDSRSEISTSGDAQAASGPLVPNQVNGMGFFAQQANIFIIGQQQTSEERRMSSDELAGEGRDSFYLGDRGRSNVKDEVSS